MRGKNRAFAAPTRALAATSCCSAACTSGRRSSNAAGRPTGMAAGSCRSSAASPRVIGSGGPPEQQGQGILGNGDLAFKLRDEVLGARQVGDGGVEFQPIGKPALRAGSGKSARSPRWSPRFAGQSPAAGPTGASAGSWMPRHRPGRPAPPAGPARWPGTAAKAASLSRRMRPNRSSSQDTWMPASQFGSCYPGPGPAGGSTSCESCCEE